MDTKNFFSKIREIIREEIEYALEKKVKTESSKKKVQQEALHHGVSMKGILKKTWVQYHKELMHQKYRLKL